MASNVARLNDSTCDLIVKTLPEIPPSYTFYGAGEGVDPS
jgi:hypothetical protein